MTATRPDRSVITGRHIELVPLTVADAPELFRVLATPAVFAGGFGGGPAGLRETLPGFTDWAASYFSWESGNVYGARILGGPDAGALVGTSTLGDFDEKREHAHIGWTAWDPRVWRTAVNPEAKLLMLGTAFDHGFGRVKLQADVLNERSRAAIARLGATFEGVVRRDMLRPDGTWRDTAVFSITIDDWPAVRAGLEARLETLGDAPVRIPE